MTSFRASARLLPLVLLLAAGLAATAAEGGRGAKGWDEQLERVTAAIEEGRYGPARSSARALVEEMARLLDEASRRGDEAQDREIFGIALSRLALAEAGLGQEDDAVWHWWVAQSFHPGLADADLARHGAPGSLLERRLAAERAAALGGKQAPVPVNASPPYRDAEGREIRPPRKLEARLDPRISLPKRRGQVVEMQMVIDREGRLVEPKLLAYRSPGAAFWAAESVRRWRFAPAELAGEPFATYYHLTIDLASRDGGSR